MAAPRRQFGPKMHRRHHHVGCAIPARLAKLVGHAAIGELREPLETEAGPRPVATQACEGLAITGAHRHACVQVEPAHLGAPRALGPWSQAFVVFLVHEQAKIDGTLVDTFVVQLGRDGLGARSAQRHLSAARGFLLRERLVMYAARPSTILWW